FDVEDGSYLQGLSSQQRALTAGQEWFAVFLQVYNNSSRAMPAASDVTIIDSEGNTYAPVFPSQTNQFAYRAGTVPSKGRLPGPDTVAGSGTTQGSLLLYKIQTASLDN